MPDPIGLAVIGAGAIAERHLQAYHLLGGVAPKWVISRPAEAAAEFARRWQFEHSGDSIEAALADASVQLVLIASPSPLHSQQALQALQAGKDIISEIPIGLSWPDAQKVAHTAENLGRRVWVCHTMRSMPAIRLVREFVNTGRLHLTHIAGFFGIPRRRNQGMGGIGTRTWIDNLLWHHGCHQLDASLWILGMPPIPRVQCSLGPEHPTLGMALDVGVQMVTAGGELITHALTYNCEHGLWQLQFIGHEDVLTFQDGRLTNEAGQELIPPTPTTDLLTQNRELLHSFRTNQPSDFDLPAVLPTMEILGRAQSSADQAG